MAISTSSVRVRSSDAVGARRRLLLVINGTDFGGTETALLQLALRLSSRGHAVHVLSIKRPGRIGDQLVAAGVPVSSLDMAEARSIAQLLRGIVALSRWMRGRHFDVVQSFLPRANVMSRVANRLGGRAPHVSCERSTDFNRTRAIQRLNRWTAPWTDCVLAVSNVVRDVVVRRDGLPAGKVSVLGNGLDLAAVDRVPRADVRRELGLDPDALLLCTVGRLVRDKGHAYLLRAVAQGIARWPDTHLVLVGEGPEDAHLRAEVRRHGLDGRVHFLGFREPVAAVLKASDVFVLPSLEEGSPVTVLEAMACALPVIASDVGGVSEMLDAGTTGLLVPAAERWGATDGAATAGEDSVRVLRKAIDVLVTDPRTRARMGRAGRRQVETRFSLESTVTAFETLYGELCGPRP